VLESNLDRLFFGIESSAFNGVGHNYGLEFLLEKKGRLSGWVNYTLAWSKKKFKELYDGKAYPSPYDRRNIANVVANYDLTKNINVSGNWSLQSGTPFYVKIDDVQQLDTLIIINESQFKGFEPIEIDYLLNVKFYNYPTHNLLNIQFSFSKEKKWGKRIWQIGVRNIFNTKKLRNPKYTIKDNQLVIFYNSNQHTFSQGIYPYVTYRFIIN
jgi:hypothetical protein